MVKNGQFLTEFELKKLIPGKIYVSLAKTFCSEKKSHCCLQNAKKTVIMHWEYSFFINFLKKIFFYPHMTNSPVFPNTDYFIHSHFMRRC